MKQVFAGAAFGFLALVGGQVSAATLTLEATVAAGTTDVSDFSVVFDDLDSDGLLSIDEVVSFSGVTFIGTSDFVFDELLVVDNIAGFTDPDTFGSWSFGQSTGLLTGTAGGLKWTYEITGMAVVPLPASVLLMLAGLGALAGVRRRRGRAGLPTPAV